MMLRSPLACSLRINRPLLGVHAHCFMFDMQCTCTTCGSTRASLGVSVFWWVVLLYSVQCTIQMQHACASDARNVEFSHDNCYHKVESCKPTLLQSRLTLVVGFVMREFHVSRIIHAYVGQVASGLYCTVRYSTCLCSTVYMYVGLCTHNGHVIVSSEIQGSAVGHAGHRSSPYHSTSGL